MNTSTKMECTYVLVQQERNRPTLTGVVYRGRWGDEFWVGNEHCVADQLPTAFDVDLRVPAARTLVMTRLLATPAAPIHFRGGPRLTSTSNSTSDWTTSLAIHWRSCDRLTWSNSVVNSELNRQSFESSECTAKVEWIECLLHTILLPSEVQDGHDVPTGNTKLCVRHTRAPNYVDGDASASLEALAFGEVDGVAALLY
jgi:hypothetical protein